MHLTFVVSLAGQYHSHKSYNVDHGNRLQVPICSYMVSEYGQAHSLRKPSEFSTVIAVTQNLDNHIQLCAL